MPRDLNEKDLAILKKLAPECSEMTCSGSGHMFHSILPPVSNHFAEDGRDFLERISRLNNEELLYLSEVIQNGSESMGCLPVEDVEAFIQLVGERISPDEAQKIVRAYESGYECDRTGTGQ
jgi:hypothetical protein